MVLSLARHRKKNRRGRTPQRCSTTPAYSLTSPLTQSGCPLS